MNTTDTIIIGEGFFGLFVGIKIAEKGYNVKIFEKKTKSLFINNLRLFFPENCTYIKKFLNKLNIAYTTIHNNNTTVSSIISNIDKMPTSLQQDTIFKDTCNNILNKHTVNLLKNEIYEIDFLFNIDTESAVQLIKRNYINIMEERKPITTPLVTGIKAVDLLAPVGRGQCMLVSGEPGTGLSELGLTSIVAQRSTGVRCVYAALGAQASRVDEVAKRLEGDGAMSHTTIVTVDDEPSEAERYAATCTAFAIAEGARALGEDVLLVLDDFTGLVNFTKDMARMAPQLNVAEGTEEQMEEYEGMLISASLAERRRFLGMTLQRVARMNDELKGGSITLMGVMYHPKGAYKKTFKSGVEGAGSGGAVLPSSVESIKGFDSMPAAVQEKLRKALEEKAKAAHVSTADDEFPESAFVQSRPMVEEFMSITDGQVFVDSYDPAKGWIISAKDSVSRIGAPGAAGPFRSLNFLQLRLDLMQSDDMGTFGSAGTEKSKLRSRSEAIRGFLKQKQGEVASLAEQTVGLFAIQKGFANNKTAEEVEDMLAKAVKRATETMREELEYINTNPSSALSEETMTKLETLLRNL